jgi:hypothetical protein
MIRVTIFRKGQQPETRDFATKQLAQDYIAQAKQEPTYSSHLLLSVGAGSITITAGEFGENKH